MLYNKYRPQTLDEVIGQSSVVETIKAAISTNKLSHSILFSGIHGTGKTSLARILAKDLGCSDIDIIELDAASHNGVEDIRGIITSTRIPPHASKFKVYIIDEAHMLSNAAFNALLKVLEEPPKHCKFILCTTEKRKIIPTVLSRCQVYDLTEITSDEIKTHLIDICNKEGIKYEEEAINFIAFEANGSMRDALSLLELCQDNCTIKNIYSKMGGVSRADYFQLLNLIAEGNIDEILIQLNTMLKGANVQRVLEDLCVLIRDLFYFKSEETQFLVIASKEEKEIMQGLFKSFGAAFCFNMLDSLNACIKPNSTNTAVILNVQICLVKLILQRNKKSN